jgi:hypothetical protein
MTSTTFVTLLAFTLAAGVVHAQEPAMPANPFILRCGAPVALDSSHANIVALAGAGNVAYQRVATSGGDKVGATVVYPKDPNYRLEIIWTDHKARTKPSTVRVGGTSQWAVDNGLRIGMSIAEVEALNRKPFRLYGFGWELGGVMLDWLDGALSRLPGGCSIQMRFGIAEQKQPAAGHPAFGENELVSSSPALRALAPTVFEFALAYPE